MFDSIRKHQRLLQFLLLLLIFPAFAFFGVSGYQRFLSDDDAVASVAGGKVTRQEFDQAMRRQLDQMREVLGNQVDPKMLDTPAARNQVLDGLVAQHALLAEAARAHLSVSDERVRETILAIPGLTRPDGSFDKERYKALLSAQGLNEVGFESQLRRDIAVQTLPEAAATSAFLPKTVVERTVKLQEQVREVRDLLLKPADFVGQVKVTDEALRKYYDENGAAFETPESAKVEYVVLSADAMAAQVSLNADDVKTYYEQNKARYSAPEERKASHILVRLERGAKDADRKAATAKAEELLKQARGGADFAALAKANSQDPGSAANGGDLGYFTRDTMVKPFADAAFSMKEGELSGIVESEFGLHIIKLTGIKAGGGRPFEQVRSEIEAELRQQQATKRFTESAEQFTNTVYEQSDSLKPAAEKFKLAIQTADAVTRTGGEKLGPKSPLSNPKLLAALFTDETLKNKRNTEAIEVGGNTLVAARVVDYRPAQRKPFESVLAEVRARVVDAQARSMAVQAGEARLKELRAGAAPTGFSEAKPVSRATAPVLPAPALDAVFKAKVDKLPAFVGVDLGPQGYGLYQVTRVVDPSAELVAQRQPGYQQQLAQLVGQQDTSDYLESLKARSKVKKFPDRLSAKSETR
jgi:peptidyl-prolyl cis-trans isomerase D